MTIEQFNDNNVEELEKDILEALKPIQRKYGLAFEIHNHKFSNVYLEATLMATVSSQDKAIEEERKKYFMEHCDDVYLSESHYGMEFTYFPDRKRYKVVGLDFHDEDNPLLVESLENGKIYRLSIMFFLNSI